MMVYINILDDGMQSVSPIGGKQFIHKFANDFAMPPANMVLETKTQDGKRVSIVVPYSDEQESYAIVH